MLTDQKLILKLSKNISNQKLKPIARLGYCELATLAGMLYLKEVFSFKEVMDYNKKALEVLQFRAFLNV